MGVFFLSCKHAINSGIVKGHNEAILQNNFPCGKLVFKTFIAGQSSFFTLWFGKFYTHYSHQYSHWQKCERKRTGKGAYDSMM